jgi:hypothetical protein
MKRTKSMKTVMNKTGGSHSSTTFWDMTPYTLVEVQQSSRAMYFRAEE